MEASLAGLTAFITGASGGIGRALADAFGAEGCFLALVAGRNLSALEQRVEERTWSERALCLSADVADPQSIENAMVRTVERFGRVDVCVANAGIWPPESQPLHLMNAERIARVLDVNLRGAVWTVRSFLHALELSGPRSDGRGASVCLIGSTAGRFGEAGHCAYAVSKAGLHGLLRTVKNEIVALDPYARCNLVEPGWTVTEMARPALDEPGAIEQVLAAMPVRQLARAEDIARAAVFFSSPALARHVTGEVLTVAGGMEGRKLWERSAIDVEAVRRRLLPDTSDDSNTESSSK